MAKANLTAEQLREIISYDQESGVFKWVGKSLGKISKFGIGSITPEGFRYLKFGGNSYRMHDLAWLYVYESFSTKPLRHINGDKADNRISNLEEDDRTAEVTANLVRDILDYNPETGDFVWKRQRSKGTKSGVVAGSKTGIGYWTIKINSRHYFAHRLAWLYCTGGWPIDQIDHIDGNPLNNRLENLRESTQAENVQNFPKVSRNTTGYPGVTFDKSRGKWMSRISVANKVIGLGRFSTPEEAAEAYKLAKAQHHTFQPFVRS